VWLVIALITLAHFNTKLIGNTLFLACGMVQIKDWRKRAFLRHPITIPHAKNKVFPINFVLKCARVIELLQATHLHVRGLLYIRFYFCS